MLAFAPVGSFAAAPANMEPAQEVEMAVPTFSGKDFQFAVRTGVGYFSGEMNEYVYKSEESPEHLSQLIWDIDSLLMGKIGLSMQYKEWLTIIADGWWKLSDGSGEMDDYDWRAPMEEWTDWSNSDIDVTSASIFDLSANMVFFRRYNYVLQGIVGIKRDNLEALACGGEYLYSGRGFRDSTGFFPDIPGIRYEQTMTSPYIGLGFEASFSDNISLSGRAIFSPLVNGEATDHHYLRSMVIEEDSDDGKMFAFDLSVGWTFRQNFVWNISAGYQKYDTIRGDALYHFNDIGMIDNYENGKGMDQEMMHLSTGLTYMF